MAIEIEFENLDNFVDKVSQYPRIIRFASNDSLRRVAFFWSNQVRRYIEQGGQNWEELHPLSREFDSRRRGGKYFMVRRSTPKQKPLGFLKNYTRYEVENGEARVFIDNRNQQPDNNVNFIRKLVERSEQGKNLRADTQLQRLFGAARQGDESQPGVDFYPIRKETTTLDAPKRPIIQPVFNTNRTRAGVVYRDSFVRNLEKQASKAFKE